MNKTLLSLIYLPLLSIFFNVSHAETVKILGHLMSDSPMELPLRGQTMDNIRLKFGNPIKEKLAVGNPPITQWEYDGFNVFFEHQRVIHAINLGTLIIPKL